MLVRDVLNATARAGGVTVKGLIADRSHDAARQRHLGYLISSRLTASSWAVINRVWELPTRSPSQRGALKAETRIAQRDPETLARLASILALLDVAQLPGQRPSTAGYHVPPKTLRARIAQTETRLNTLRAQLRMAEGDAR